MPAKKTAPKVPEDETSRQRFQRLSESRVTKAVNAIDTLGKLADGRYDRTPEDTAVVLQPIKDALAAVEAKFTAEKPANGRKAVKLWA